VTGIDTVLRTRALRMRQHVVAMAASPQGAHAGGSLSCVDILAVLYFAVLRLRPAQPDWPERDRFILSKGHASAALYAALAERGFIEPAELATYGRTGGRLGGHPTTAVPGVEMGTGSLGHGLSLGAGMAMAARWDRRRSRTVVLLGDGELQEGSVWEAAMFASQHRLGSLVAVVDRNHWQQSGRTEEIIGLEPLAERFRAFGWTCVEVDGHDVAALRATLAATRPDTGPPCAVLARTVKGRGVGFLRDRRESHYARLSPRLLARAMTSLAGPGEPPP
jgi:transketolase